MGIDPQHLSDDDLDVLIRSLDPVRESVPEGPLTERELDVLRGIQRGRMPVRQRDRIISRPPAHIRKRARSLVPATLAVMVAIIAVVVTSTWVSSTPAAALTPRALEITVSANSLGEVTALAQERLRNPAGPAHAQRSVHSVGWYLHLDNLPAGETTTLISPEVTTKHWNPDGSGHERVVAGDYYLADGSIVPSDDLRAPEPGAVLFDTTYPPGGIDSPIAEVPGDSVADVKRLLEAYWTSDRPSASDVIVALSSAFSQWTLTNEQHAHILDLIDSSGGAEVAGTAQDRAGREVTVVAVDSTSNPDYRHLLLISNSTGRIVGVEDVRLTPLGSLPAGSVTSYILWDTESE